MNFKKLFKKRKSKNKPLNLDSKKEKKLFLSMDLIERMIRVEQRVSASFGEHISCNKTEYYKNLSKLEKKKFNQYLERKKTRKFLIRTFLLLILLSPIFLKIRFSGKVISENLQVPVLLLEKILFFLFLGFISILSILIILKKIKKRKFEKHFKVLDGIALKHSIHK